MRFGIAWEQTEGGHQNLAFKGEWTPNIIAQNISTRYVSLRCFGKHNHY